MISNGVINLSADKGRAFAEAARVLRAGGRMALADIVTERHIDPRTSCQADLWAACIAGASQRDLGDWLRVRTDAPAVDKNFKGLRSYRQLVVVPRSPRSRSSP